MRAERISTDKSASENWKFNSELADSGGLPLTASPQTNSALLYPKWRLSHATCKADTPVTTSS